VQLRGDENLPDSGLAHRWRLTLGARRSPPATVAGLVVRSVRRRHRPGRRRVSELIGQANASMSSSISLIDVCGPDQPLVYVNAAFERLTGYSTAEALGRNWKLQHGVETDREVVAGLAEAIDRGEELRVVLRQYRRDGTAYWSETLMVPAHAENRAVTHYLSVQKDITAKTEEAQRSAHMAYHDTLTGLPNRAQLQEHLSLALARAERKDGAFAVVFLDLNLFKQVNDQHGHEAGDRLLEAVARRWRSVARDGDVLARYGGDEFVLLITDLPHALARDTAEAAAARYADSLTLPFDTSGTPRRLIEISVSAGIALYPHDATAPAALLLAADAEMYASKRSRTARPDSRTTP
jgi:diguanylate cyclase (GGDEF)-like protein/PAS domain S-box-containing protein